MEAFLLVIFLVHMLAFMVLAIRNKKPFTGFSAKRKGWIVESKFSISWCELWN